MKGGLEPRAPHQAECPRASHTAHRWDNSESSSIPYSPPLPAQPSSRAKPRKASAWAPPKGSSYIACKAPLSYSTRSLDLPDLWICQISASGAYPFLLPPAICSPIMAPKPFWE
jgi:hypothetical protein